MNLQNLLSNTTSDRNTLKPHFNTGEIPTQTDFHTLIDGLFRLRDDSIYKDADNGLCIKAGTDTNKTALLLYDDFNDPKWTIAIQNGFHIKDSAGNNRVSIRNDNSISIRSFTISLDGQLTIKDSNNAGVIYFPSTGTFPNFYIRSGNSASYNGRFFISGTNGNVGIGTSNPNSKARLQVKGGAIMPQEGNGEDSGILFPPDAYGGSGDRAYIRYYRRGATGEETMLEIGNLNDGSDHIALMTNGNVGIGINNPQDKLHLNGNLTTNWGVKFDHYQPSFVEPNQVRQTWLHKDWTGTHGDFLYIGSTGNRPIAEQHAIMITEKLGIIFGTAKQDARGVSTEFMRINNSGLQVMEGAIMPQEGNGEDSGILFPPDAFGGGGDRAYIRYYRRGATGEETTLEIGNLNDGSDHIALMTNGNVGIGTTNPESKLHITGNAGVLRLQGSDHVYIELYPDGPNTRKGWIGYRDSNNNNLIIRNDIGLAALSSGSDKKLKKKIKEASGLLNKVLQIKPVWYNYKTDSKNASRKIGVIAQDLLPVFPELVDEETTGSGEKMLYVDYQHFGIISIRAIQELKQEFDEFKKMIIEKIGMTQ